MMLFKKQDQAEKLIEIQKSDQKKLDALQRKLEAIHPEWTRLQEETERLCALNDSFVATFRRFIPDDQSAMRLTRTHEQFHHEREEELTRLIEEACKKRDDLTYELTVERQGLKQSTFMRLSIVSGAFGSWASQVASAEKYIQQRGMPTQYQLSDQAHEELLAAAKQAETIQDMRELIDFIKAWVERIEDLEDVQCPIFRLDVAVQSALDYKPQTARFPEGNGPVGPFITTGPGISY
jgi:hypothetical protein